jgi:hypothetical protein
MENESFGQMATRATLLGIFAGVVAAFLSVPLSEFLRS